MSKARVEQIERELSELDANAMAFDHWEAEQCKLVLVRIADKAARLCEVIRIEVAREDQKPRGWRIGAEKAAQQAAHEAKLRASGSLVDRGAAEFKRAKS